MKDMNNLSDLKGMKDLNGFDLSRYADVSSEKNDMNPVPSPAPAAHAVPTPAPAATEGCDEQQIRMVADLLVSRGIDITDSYSDWLNLGFALADGLGEQGRAPFHELSRLSAKYTPSDCDKQYTHCLKGRGHGITIKTFFRMAQDAGVDISRVAREAQATKPVCATCAKVPTGTNNEKAEKKGVLSHSSDFVPHGTMAQVAQNTPIEGENDAADFNHTFADKLRRDDLPSFLFPVLDSMPDAVGQDKMLLGTLNIVSGLLPSSYYGIYDRKQIFAPLFNIVYGRFASSKGDLGAVRELAAPLKKEMAREFEKEMDEYKADLAAWEAEPKKSRGPEPKEPARRSPFVSANSSASVVYRALEANDGWGIMHETEADTLSNMLSSDYGDYSDLLRRVFQNESIAMVRVTERIHIDIERPRMSVFLTCTGSQLPILLPTDNVSNGLASRFLFYQLPKPPLVFRDVFAGSDKPITDIYKELGEQLMPLIHALQRRADRPIQFVLSRAQQQQFVDTFNDVLHEQFYMLGDGIQGFIYRIALDCFRYSMVLTALRRLSQWNREENIFDENEQALICDDRDFRTAMTIVECLVSHTGRVYAVLATADNDPFAKLAEPPSPELKAYFLALPAEGEFKTAMAMEVAKAKQIPERTAKRYLGDMVAKYQVLGRLRQGVYMKTNVKSSNHEAQ